MKILIVRHAEPNYVIDGLTDKGRREAELLSRRLCRLDVKDFFVSPLGRAQQTAAYTLEKMNRTAETLPWLHEFRGHCFDEEAGRVRICWDFKPHQVHGHPMLLDMDAWPNDPLLSIDSNIPQIWQETVDGINSLLLRYGYRRDGAIYRCDQNTDDTLVFFCHFGIGSCLLGYLCNIPPMLLLQGTCMQPSSVTTIVTEERVKGEVAFRCTQLGDISHLWVADEKPSTAGLFPECYTGIDSTDPPEWAINGCQHA